MNPVHMSADETAGEEKTHPPVWSIIESAWMSKELKEFLHWLDDLYRQDWAHPSGRHRTPGNPPRHRIPSKKPPNPDCVAPRGMPRMFYNPAWLAKLKPHQIDELTIDDGDVVDLSIHADIDVVSDNHEAGDGDTNMP